MTNKVIGYIEIPQNTQILKIAENHVKNTEFIMASSRPKHFYQMFKRKGGGVKECLNNVKNFRIGILGHP